MRIAIIPARGGSKRIPKKNIRMFYGHPMISWSIKAAQKSGLFDHIIVSTDDINIAQVAENYGASVPFIRPAHLSDDYTGVKSVVAHAINELESTGIVANYVCCIFATAPFIHQDDLRWAYEKLERDEVSFSFPVTRFSAPIQRAIRIDSCGYSEMFNPNSYNTRSQDLEPAYYDSGQFYWGKKQAWLQDNIIFSKISSPIIIPNHRVQDIDTEDDWRRAEIIFKAIYEA